MSIKVETLVREFQYNGLSLPDPSPNQTPDQVRDIYSAAYPEIRNYVAVAICSYKQCVITGSVALSIQRRPHAENYG